MEVLTGIGATLERVGQRLQSREAPREPVTPYEHAKRLWQTVDPRRETDPMKSLFLPFRFADNGVKARSAEQEIFTKLMLPYRSLFPQLDVFCVMLSIGHRTDDVSFAATVLAPPPSPLFNQRRLYPVLAVRELPSDDDTRYNLLVLGESKLYTGKLGRELLGLDPLKGLIWREFKDWSDAVRGDINWRRHFTNELFDFWTEIVKSGGESMTRYNREVQAGYREREKLIPWWERFWQDRLQRGAVWPYLFAVYNARGSHYDLQAYVRAVACFQQA